MVRAVLPLTEACCHPFVVAPGGRPVLSGPTRVRWLYVRSAERRFQIR